MKIIKLSLLCCLAIAASSCSFVFTGVNGKGPVTEKTFTINQPFHAVEATSGWDVELIKSNHPKIVVRSEENLIALFQYKIENGKLRIYNKKNIGESKSRVVEIYYQSLASISASSGSELSSNVVFNQKKIHLSVSSGAEMNLTLKTENCTASASSGGSMELSGASVNFKAHASSGGSLDANNLKTKTTTAEASSGGDISTYVLENLDASTSSGGSIDYKGNPAQKNIDRSISGGDISASLLNPSHTNSLQKSIPLFVHQLLLSNPELTIGVFILI